MDILVVKKSFWRTKLFTAAIAEMVLIVLVYVLTELITGNKMFAIGMVAAFSIFSIYILGPIIGWFQVVIIRATSFVSIIEGIVYNNIGNVHVGIRIIILLIGASIPIFLTAYLWAKEKSYFQKDDYCEKKQISQIKAVSLVVTMIIILNSLFYFC